MIPDPPIPYADLSADVRNGRYRLPLLLLVIIVAVGQDMEHSAISINSGHRRHSVPVCDETLRRCNSFEYCFGCCWWTGSGKVAAYNQAPLAAIRVTDAENHKAPAIVCQSAVPDVIDRPWGRAAFGPRPTDHSSNSIRAAGG